MAAGAFADVTGMGVTDQFSDSYFFPRALPASVRHCRGLSEPAGLGLKRAPAFTPEVASGTPMLLSAQVPPWKKEGKTEAGQRPSYRSGSL